MSVMFRSTINAVIREEALSATEVYERMSALADSLSSVHPLLRAWVEPPRRGDPGAVELADASRFKRRIERNAAEDAHSYPTLPTAGGAEASLRNARTDADWAKAGRTIISYTPWCGRLELDIKDPVGAFGERLAPVVVRGCIAALAETLDTSFIAADVYAWRQNEEGYDTYALDHRLFPHRRWLGWMGFVPELVPHRYLPEAAAVHVVTGRGTIIVSVEGCLDLRNKAHLRQVHEVEARMAQLGLLDVTDATLLD
ncbi:Imm52 family immunity protein [Stenotrophomonas sp.]|uniref:Imm52 family immunity protein n=1 Tax=Stenotrophomonas sp. TaxID=69392 RepID=UPI0028A5B103|nr:Imm52 family immunity protein [Stenotrophomonas sp.]